jgi:cation diffusion facilitator CzcD-associated flavoprotein CzcO
MSEHQVVVVGAGSAGVASGLALKDVGLDPLVIDRADEVGSAWRGRYDRLRLNTCRPVSHLPARPFPKGTPMFPSRDEIVEHLERHAYEEELDLQLGTNVERIDRENGRWLLRTSVGPVRSMQVVVATGYEQTPQIPEWSGRDQFEGVLIHACDYRNPAPFNGKRVLVVGPGCSGMEIAHDLAEGGASEVWLSARTPPNIVLRRGPGGLPGDLLGAFLLHFPVSVADAVARFGQRMAVGELASYGLPAPAEGVFSRLRRTGQAPAIVDMEVIEAIKAGRFTIVPGVDSLDSTGVRLSGGGGARVEPDAVICATGYRRGLERLVGHLDLLDERGVARPLGREPAAPGLRFIGYVPRPGGLGYMAKEATHAAKAIAYELRTRR